MEKQLLKNIRKDITLLSETDIQAVYNFIKFLQHKDSIIETAELIENKKSYELIKKGLKDKTKGDVFDWEKVK